MGYCEIGKQYELNSKHGYWCHIYWKGAQQHWNRFQYQQNDINMSESDNKGEGDYKSYSYE